MSKTDLPQLTMGYYEQFISKAMEALPKVLIFMSIIMIGWLVAWLASLFIRKMTQGLKSISDKLFSYVRPETRQYHRLDLSKIISRITFWFIILSSLMLALHTLESKIIDYLLLRLFHNFGSLIVCASIIMTGFITANFFQAFALRNKTFAQLPYHNVFRSIIVIFFIVLGLQQLTIKLQLLNHILLIAFAAGLLSLILASLYTLSTVLPDIIAMKTIGAQLKLGQNIQVGTWQGQIIAINNMSITLENDDEIITVAGSRLQKESISQHKQVK